MWMLLSLAELSQLTVGWQTVYTCPFYALSQPAAQQSTTHNHHTTQETSCPNLCFVSSNISFGFAELVATLHVLGDKLEGNEDAEDRSKILVEYTEIMSKVAVIESAKKELCVEMDRAIEENKDKLEQEKIDFLSGAYLKRDEKVQNREPTPEPEEHEMSLFERIQDGFGSLANPNIRELHDKRKPNQMVGPVGAKRPKPSTYIPAAVQKQIPKPRKPVRRTKQYCHAECELQDGEMVGCDNDNCKNGEWFHLVCVGLSVAPPENAKWFCDQCRQRRR
jgi:hypothetical protein